MLWPHTKTYEQSIYETVYETDDNNPKVFVVNMVGSHIANETAPKKSKRKSLYRGISGPG